VLGGADEAGTTVMLMANSPARSPFPDEVVLADSTCTVHCALSAVKIEPVTVTVVEGEPAFEADPLVTCDDPAWTWVIE